MKINVERDPWDTKKLLFRNSELELEPGITCLVGRNGSGKSTLLMEIEEHCRVNKIPFYKYDNFHEGGSHALSEYSFLGDFSALATNFMSSEGQRIVYDFVRKIKGIVAKIKENKSKQAVISLDALDSGLDLYNLRDINRLLRIILDELKDKEIYFVLACNSFELVRDNECIYPKTFKKMKFHTYEEYHKFIVVDCEPKKRGKKDE